MDLTLFIVFLVLSLLLVALGLYRSEHTELSLVGFLFLFLLSLIIMGGDIQYKTGENLTYSCLCCNNTEPYTGVPYLCDGTDANLVVTSTVDTYETWSAGGTLSHLVGYWLAIASFVGFIGVLLSLRRQF
jgi:hypothetical protein